MERQAPSAGGRARPRATRAACAAQCSPSHRGPTLHPSRHRASHQSPCLRLVVARRSLQEAAATAISASSFRRVKPCNLKRRRRFLRVKLDGGSAATAISPSHIFDFSESTSMRRTGGGGDFSESHLRFSESTSIQRTGGGGIFSELDAAAAISPSHILSTVRKAHIFGCQTCSFANLAHKYI